MDQGFQNEFREAFASSMGLAFPGFALLSRQSSDASVIALFEKPWDAVTLFVLVVGRGEKNEFSVEIAWTRGRGFPWSQRPKNPFLRDGGYNARELQNESGRVRLSRLAGKPSDCHWGAQRKLRANEMLAEYQKLSQNLLSAGDYVPPAQSAAQPEVEKWIQGAVSELKQFAVPLFEAISSAHNATSNAASVNEIRDVGTFEELVRTAFYQRLSLMAPFVEEPGGAGLEIARFHCRVTPALNFWVLVINSRIGRRFSVEIARSRLPVYPEIGVTAHPLNPDGKLSSQVLTSGDACRLRLSGLWGERGHFWTLNDEDDASKSEASRVGVLVQQACERLRAYAIPFFDEVAQALGLSKAWRKTKS